MEHILRTLILVIGWPVLITISIFLVIRAIQFYRDTGKIIFGKLVLIMVFGWLVSMYSLAIIATAYMFDVPNSALVVFPIFIIWFITIITILWTVLRWNKEAVKISSFYRRLEGLVKERTQELEKKTDELEKARVSLEIKVRERTRELEKLTKGLDKRIKEKIKELQEKMAELERFNKVAVGRELKMIELKEEIKNYQEELEKYKKAGANK